jgi:hypothetical protein
LAKLREYNEPFRLVDPAPDAHAQLWRALRASRLACTFRATYEHVGGPFDKRGGARLLTSLYRRALGTVMTVRLDTTMNMNPTSPVRSLPRATNRMAWFEALLDLTRNARERGQPTSFKPSG